MALPRQIEQVLNRWVDGGVLDRERADEVRRALETGEAGSLFDAVVGRGIFTADRFLDHLGEALQLPVIDLSDPDPETEALRSIPAHMARERRVLPLFILDDILTVAVADPFLRGLTEELQRASEKNVRLVLADPRRVEQAVDRLYPASALSVAAETVGRRAAPDRSAMDALLNQIGRGELPPVVALVNQLLEQAVAERASDVHIEPEADRLVVRFRIDGVLRHILDIPKAAEQGVISRVKVMAGMDIAQRLRPQDGKVEVQLQGRSVDLRVSTLPTMYGENVVLRLLDPAALQTRLDSLGFDPETLRSFERLIHRPYGLILVTGPTGSGKTTTLYSTLTSLVSEEINIMSIEDPVEYRLAGVRQVQVNPAAGLTFASTLRSILRQDPDVVLVGEVRDLETAHICIQAAMTGHLVLTTLHTNDAPSALGRLSDMGVPAFLVGATVLGVLAQRLVRKPCPACSRKGPFPADLKALLEVEDWPEDVPVARPVGCGRCRQTGYSGRIGLFELLVPDENVRRAMMRGADTEELTALARKHGMRTLREDGLEKVKAGLTTPEEVARVCL